jgi:cytochrome P450
MMRLLTPKRLAENEEFMWRLADQRIDTFIERGTCDFIAEYAQPFAMLVIADLLGVPEADQAKLRALFVEMGAPGAVGKGDELPNKPLWFLDDFFLAYVEDRRAHPRDDVLTKLALNTFADGRLPEPMEAVNAATILFAGGQGTSARFLGNMVHFIAEHPDVQQRLRDQRHLVPNFIEEMLRYESPVKINQRLARRTTTLAGVTIPAGSTLLLLLPAGDRDERRFGCPAEFRVDRENAREHVAFGRGVHSCPGAPLVRADARATLERVLDRLHDIRISDEHHGPPGDRRFQYTNTYILRGVDALHIEFTAA